MMKQLNHSTNSCSRWSLVSTEIPYSTEEFVTFCSLSWSMKSVCSLEMSYRSLSSSMKRLCFLEISYRLSSSMKRLCFLEISYRLSSSMKRLCFLEISYRTEDFVTCSSVSQFSFKCTSIFPDARFENRSFHTGMIWHWSHLPLIRKISITTAITINAPQPHMNKIYRFSHLGCGHLLLRALGLLHSTEEVIWAGCPYDTWCWVL